MAQPSEHASPQAGGGRPGTDSDTDHGAVPVLAARIALRRASSRAAHKGLLGSLGPGLITGASDDDPSGIATYSQTGAQFGYAMCWVMLFCFPLMAAIQEISARMGRTTGQGIAGNIRAHYPRLLLYVIVGLLLLANTINLGADLGAMAAALKLLVGGPGGLYVAGFAIGCTWLEVFSQYQRYVSILKRGSFVVFAYVAVALVVDVPWGQVLHSTFVPSFSLQKDYVVTVVAVLGTTITPYCFFWQSSQEAEDERVDPTAHALIDGPEQAPAEISRMRFDTYIGMGYSNVISLFIIVATAATLNANGVTDIQTSAQAAEALRPIAGVFTFALFAASICSRSPCSPPLAPTRSARRSGGPPVSNANRSTPRHSTSRSRFQPLSASASTSSASIRSSPILVGGNQRRRRGSVDGDHHAHGDARRRNGRLRAAACAVGDRVVHGDDGRCRCDHVCDLVRSSRRGVEVEYGRPADITQRIRPRRGIIHDWRGRRRVR
jgi:NRAMP (natural resistance-associated macrophage protein)-like metal ion transporter